jgi:hypothetical protein
MRTTNIKTKVGALLAAVGILFLAGCSNGLMNDTPQAAARSNQLRIVIAGVDARTTRPTVGTLIYTYEITEPSAVPEDSIPSDGSITLGGDGDYSITFNGYAGPGTTNLVVSKEVTGITVANGAIGGTPIGGTLDNGTLSVVLEPVQGANGTLVFGDHVLDDADSVSITVYAGIDNTAYTTLDGVDSWNNGVWTTTTVPDPVAITAGRYVVVIELTDNASKVALYREPVVIWAGLTTTLDWTPSTPNSPSS